ncbi:hypothetical protein [Mucilaginibacter agri]|uniref:YARHG domain-containing protein n=1 Tax=Mucilaginibacter agri TaxID=2695265 RepID=A0A966DRB9_9SPHI|nr:hypothetical protein [Mucilaginibacter agri]NCD68903.1 hypothetical protein [Mucilaginibacter agri]
MKSPLLIILLLGAFCAQAKSKTDSTAVATTNPVNKADTVACWFKELKLSRYSYGWFRRSQDSTYKEVWQHGYMVKAPTVAYLYADKKTPVKNKVVNSFERK